MTAGYWQQVMATGLSVPSDRPLDDLTAELTTLLGSTDPAERDGTAYPTLSTWIGRGVYDDLLSGLGDGMASGLSVGLGERESDDVFRRSYSVLVLADCVERDNQRELLPPGKLLEWGDRVTTWYLREHDLRGFVPGHGWAHALAHGADALGALGASPHLGTPELTVLLDVLADRLVLPEPQLLVSGEPDRMAAATLRILRRDLVPLSVVEPWVSRLSAAAGRMSTSEDRDPYLDTGNAEAFLRALHLQVALAPHPPALRSDLLLVLVEALRATNPHYLAAHGQPDR
ncbi:MAG TPA: DUF2785 domain-containing protein [Nocardioides sp.]|uniref:DUF2785 domain-containing protein n=1 Tax=Nocardioides sp. TaxID=35761 RepID=UPI002BCABF5E|nr:DUF2785 domain-containing protein [Nocardioides sp.]HQR26284.1 DUF2785 domain-containing protein [Nocardioides sp.]